MTARHFYELFETQEALLRVVYDEICAELLAAAAPGMAMRASTATRIRMACAAYFSFITADPRRARIFAIEWVDVGAAVERREQAIREIFVATTLEFETQTAAIDVRLLAIALVGIAKALTAEWLASDDKPTVDAMTDHLATIWSRALRVRSMPGR